MLTADFAKSGPLVKRERTRVRGVEVDLAGQIRRVCESHAFEIRVEEAPDPRATPGWRDDDPIDVDEARVAAPKPEEVRAVIRRTLGKRQQETSGFLALARDSEVTGLRGEFFEIVT